MRIHTGRKTGFEDSVPNNDRNNDRFLDNRELEEMERRQRESISPVKSQYVRLSDNSNTSGQNPGTGSPADKVSFADLRKQKARDQFHSSGINITYTEQEKEDLPKKSSVSLLSRRDSQRSSVSGAPMVTSTEGPNANSDSPSSPAPGKKY